MRWYRVRVSDKNAWREDLQEDPTLTDLQKRMISIVARNWDNSTMRAECSGSFIAVGAGTTEKMVKRYKQSLIDSGRVAVKRAATYTTSTLWNVNWWFRGSAYIRHTNGGEPILDCRKVVPSDAQEVVPSDAQGGSPGLRGGQPWGGPQVGTQFHTEVCDKRPLVAHPYTGAQGTPEDEKKNKPSATPAGFAKWKIVHAEWLDEKGKPDEDGDKFVAHLRSGASRKFVIRCDIDSDDYASLDRALTIDGEAGRVIGAMVMMSTNRSGPKEFRRAGPMAWVGATILSGETSDDGGAVVRLSFHDEGGGDSDLHLSPEQSGALAEACGGEAQAIGRRIRYRCHPDDSLEFRAVATETVDA
ncbi:hypothetical protein VQ044_04485 [Aurantimonas sp. C2-5-R2]|uniref:hypothetical protein n=1 Tax=Aurantimonas sp. C2-5-R2 TaxID=3113713 RepID=UPI002F92B7EB